MTQQVQYKDGSFYPFDLSSKGRIPVLNLTTEQIAQAKQQLLDLYCNSCEIKSSQLEDPSNEGRIYTVEI